MTEPHLDRLPRAETDVLVVGAGPTGLMAALVLARRGLDVTIVDGKHGPTRESRAVVVHPRSMELYAQLGLAGQVLERSWRATGLRPARERDVARFDLSRWQTGDTPYPGIHVFEQSANEELLAAALAQAGVDVRWGRRLVSLEDGGEHVDALVAADDGELGRVRARWCVGADGSRSLVRRLLDVPFEGVTDDATFWVADLYGARGLPEREVGIRFGPQTFVISFPLGDGGHVRVIGLAQGADCEEGPTLGHLHEEFGLGWDRVEWFSSYRVRHRVADRFRVGRCFLAGDAAHVHSPVGGQGMNTGLQDAHGLAHLLADVRQGRLEVAALDRYEHERRPVARTLVAVTDRAFGVVGRRGRGWAVLRRVGVGLGARVVRRLDRAGGGRLLGGLVGQYRIHYHVAPAEGPTPAWADDPVVGRRLPPSGVDAPNHDALASMRWQLHAYGADASRPDVPAHVDGPLRFPADPTGRLRADRLYLVRPDGFVAAALPLRDGRADPGDVRRVLDAHRLTASRGTG